MVSDDAFAVFHDFVKEHVDLLNRHLEQETRLESLKQKRQTVEKILDTVVKCLNGQESEAYGHYVARLERSKKGKFRESTKKKKSVVIEVKSPSKDEWSCRGCNEPWRVLKGTIPSLCMEFAVNRDGQPTNAEGCGSTNIERARHEKRGLTSPLTSIVSGEYALIAGRQISCGQVGCLECLGTSTSD